MFLKKNILNKIIPCLKYKTNEQTNKSMTHNVYPMLNALAFFERKKNRPCKINLNCDLNCTYL